MASQWAPSLAPHLTTNGVTPEPGLTRRTLVSGLGGLGALILGATWAKRGAAAPTAVPELQVSNVCGGNLGLEWLQASFQGQPAPDSHVVEPGASWQAYFHPTSPLISFRYPDGWQPETIQSGLVGVTLYSPRRDALFGLGTGQFQQEVTLQTLLSLAFEAIFSNDLRQEVGQQLCAVQFPPPIPTATSVFTAAQNATSIVAIAVSVTYEQGTTISADSNLVPTVYTTLVYNTFAGPIDQFPSLVEQAFFPILRQLTYWPIRSTEDPDDNGDDDGGDDGGGG